MASALGALDNPHDLGSSPSRLPRGVQWAVMVLFILGILVASGFAVTEHWRRATFVLGITLMWLAGARLTCDSRVVGVFAVRSRRFDALFTAALGGTMALLAASVDSLGS